MKLLTRLRKLLVPYLYALLLVAAMTVFAGFALAIFSMHSTTSVTLCPAHDNTQVEAFVDELVKRFPEFSVELHAVEVDWCERQAWTLEYEKTGTIFGNISRNREAMDILTEHGIQKSGIRVTRKTDETAVPLAGVVLITLLSIVFLLYQRRSGRFVSRPDRRNSALFNLMIGVGVGTAAYLLLNVIGNLLHLVNRLPQQLHWDPNVAGPNVEGLFVILILAPVFEEIVFRAWLLEAWRKVMPPALALVLTAALFSIIHPMGVLANVLLLIPGLAFGLIWLKTRSLMACITAHATWNGLVLLLMWILGD